MMTRSMNRPDSPKGRYAGIGSQPPRLHDGGVYKRQSISPTRRTVKLIAKSSTVTQQECIAQLQRLLPKVANDEQERMTELDLVERTIAYIAHLKGILNASNNQDSIVQSTVDLLKNMTV